MHQLRNSCVSAKWAFVGFLRRLGESLRVLSREFGHVKKFRNDLKAFQISKGTIRFSPEKPLPAALVKKLVKARMGEVKG